MGQYPLSIWVLFFLAPLAHPQTPPVHLLPTPQKFRTFHKLEDAVVPPALKAPPQLLPAGATAAALATDGAIWQGS